MNIMIVPCVLFLWHEAPRLLFGQLFGGLSAIGPMLFRRKGPINAPVQFEVVDN